MKLVMDSIFWGMKHLTRDIQEYSLDALESLLVQLTQSVTTASTQHKQFAEINPIQICNDFYQSYVFIVIKEVFGVLTDTFHRSSLHKHCSILSVVIQMVSSNRITVQLQAPQELQQHIPQVPADPTGNQLVVKFVMVRLLLGAFSTVTQQQVEGFVQALFDSGSDSTKFKQHVTNFLIQLKEFSSTC
eukprot:UN02779